MTTIVLSCCIFYRLAVAEWTKRVLRRVSKIKTRAEAKKAETANAAAAIEAGAPGVIQLADAPPVPAPDDGPDDDLDDLDFGPQPGPAPGPAPAPAPAPGP